MQIDTEALIKIGRKAGKAIIDVYNDPQYSKEVNYKSDDSPLTLADKASHQVIVGELEKVHPNIPIISEEGKQIPFETRKGYGYYWLVDPLDGTKEFISRNGEFTVNIALIYNKKPIAGFIYVPVWGSTYYAVNDAAYKIDSEGDKIALSVNNKKVDRIAVRSKSHASDEEQEVLDRYDVKDSISVGSSLKFCMVAEGKADIYYRHGPTMEWDTAAGQAVAEGAGGKVFKGTGPEPFLYNRKNMLNGSFLCLGF